MTPQTLVIDRNFRGVGRIKLATGTTDPALRRKYSRMLDAFKDDGRVDLLRALRDHTMSFAEAYDAYRRRALSELATGETAQRLSVAWAAWLAGMIVPREVSVDHHQSLTGSGKYLAALAPRARVVDLPRVLRKLRDTLGAPHPRSFNLARAAATAFVRDTVGKAHPLWVACMAVPVRKGAKPRKGKPLSPAQMVAHFPHPELDPLDKIAWDIALTGMNEKEFWGEWRVTPDSVRIEGTKRHGRARDIPLVRAPSPPSMYSRTYTDKVRERTQRAIQPNDLRRTYAHWMEEAEIPRSRRRIYMGHGAKDSTDLYEHREAAHARIHDARRLRDLLRPHTKAHTKNRRLRAVS